MPLRTIEQKIRCTRYCIEPNPKIVGLITGFIDGCNYFLSSSKIEKISMVGCYSYDFIPHVMRTAPDSNYMIMDIHYMDFFADFLQLDGTDETIKAFFYKYMSEIESKKGCYAYSQFWQKKLSGLNSFVAFYDNTDLLKQCFLCGMQLFYHELAHAAPEAFGKTSFLDFFNHLSHDYQDIKKEDLYPDEFKKMSDECYSDFIALSMTEIQANVWDMNIEFRYNLYIKLLASLQLFRFLSSMTIDSLITTTIDISMFNVHRIGIDSHILAMIGRYDRNSNWMNVDLACIMADIQNIMTSFMKNISDSLIDIANDFNEFIADLDVDKVNRAGFTNHLEAREKAWIYSPHH